MSRIACRALTLRILQGRPIAATAAPAAATVLGALLSRDKHAEQLRIAQYATQASLKGRKAEGTRIQATGLQKVAATDVRSTDSRRKLKGDKDKKGRAMVSLEKFVEDLRAGRLSGDTAWHTYRLLDQESKAQLTIDDYNRLLRALRQKHMARSTATLQRMQRVHIEMATIAKLQPNSVSYNELMYVQLALLNFDQARFIFNEMKLKGLPIDLPVYNTMLLGYSRPEGSVDEARHLWNELLKRSETDLALCPDVISFTMMIRCECKAGDMERVEELLRLMDSMGVKADVELRNTLLEGIASMRGLKAALEEAKRMMAADCCPGLNARSYMILLQYAKREGDVDAAKRLLGDAIRAGAVPSGWVLAGQTNLTSAEVLGVLEKSELMPGVDDYNKFVNLAVRTNDFHTAHRLLDRMKAGSVRPNAVTYSVLIDTYCKGGDVEKALEIYREMLGDRSLTPDQHIYSQLFEGIARSGTPNADEVARMLLGHMDELGIRPNTVVYNTLLMVYTQQSPPNLQECHDIMRRLVSDPNAGPDTRTYNILFSAYASVNRPIAGYAKQLWKWYTEMKTKYMLRRDGFTYSLAVRALHRARDWRYAWAVYEQALTAADSDPRVLRDCFTGPEMMVSLMELCLGQQQPERVMQLWYDGRRLGMRPDSRMVVLMLHACARLGAINAARANIEGLMGIPATARRRPTDDHGDDYGDAQGEEDVMLPLHDPMEKLDLALKTAAPPPEGHQGMQHVSTSTSPSQSLISPLLLPAAVSTHASPTTRVLSPQLMLVYLVMLVRFGRSQEVMPTICKWLTRVPSAKITEPMASKLLETLRASPADQPLASELLQYLEENFPDAVPI